MRRCLSGTHARSLSKLRTFANGGRCRCSELLLETAAHTFVMSELPDMASQSRDQLYEVMFEHFDIPVRN
jgi:hypothetical protein